MNLCKSFGKSPSTKLSDAPRYRLTKFNVSLCYALLSLQARCQMTHLIRSKLFSSIPARSQLTWWLQIHQARRTGEIQLVIAKSPISKLGKLVRDGFAKCNVSRCKPFAMSPSTKQLDLAGHRLSECNVSPWSPQARMLGHLCLSKLRLEGLVYVVNSNPTTLMPGSPWEAGGSRSILSMEYLFVPPIRQDLIQGLFL